MTPNGAKTFGAEFPGAGTRVEQPAGPRSLDDHGIAGLIGYERKVGETVLERGFIRNKRHDKLSIIFGGAAATR